MGTCWASRGSGLMLGQIWEGGPGRCSGVSHIIVYNQYLLGATCNTQMCQFLLSMATCHKFCFYWFCESSTWAKQYLSIRTHVFLSLSLWGNMQSLICNIGRLFSCVAMFVHDCSYWSLTLSVYSVACRDCVYLHTRDLLFCPTIIPHNDSCSIVNYAWVFTSTWPGYLLWAMYSFLLLHVVPRFLKHQ